MRRLSETLFTTSWCVIVRRVNFSVIHGINYIIYLCKRTVNISNLNPRKAIGYNFIIGGDGKIYEGRGFKVPQTAGKEKTTEYKENKACDEKTIAFAVAGTYGSKPPTSSVKKAINGYGPNHANFQHQRLALRDLSWSDPSSIDLYNLLKSILE